MFLRGYGSQYSSHYNWVNHFSGALGQIQGDASRRIYGNAVGYEVPSMVEADGVFQSRQIWQGQANLHSYGNKDSWGFSMDSARLVPTDVENRPVNKAVRYLIRAL